MAEENKTETSKEEVTKEEAAPTEKPAETPKKAPKPKIDTLTKDVLELVEIAAAPSTMGKIKKGVNEVTKAIERGNAKLVVTAEDVNPKEIVAHIPLICGEKGIKHLSVPNKTELGNAAGLNKPCSSIAIISAGEGEGKELLMKLAK